MKRAILNILLVLASMTLGAGLMFFVMDKKYNEEIVEEEPVETPSIVKLEESGLSTGIENVYDAVVVIENYKNDKLTGTGSGFVYSSEGYVMTNHHVIANAEEIKVIFTNGETVIGTLIGSDDYADIAVVKVDKESIIKVATIGNNEENNIGDTVFTIGSPMSLDYAGTVTRGIISGKNRLVEVSVKNKSTNDWVMNVMQTDAAINPGNSGGPLCDINGNVIGVNSMKIVQDEIEGIGFAIPIEEAMEYANMFTNGEEIKRPVLGIKMSDISSSSIYLAKNNIKINSSIKKGVVVLEVFDDGPCKDIDIEVGDVIVKLGNYKIESAAKLKYYLSKYKPGDEVDLVVKRDTEELTFKVTLGS